MPNKNSIESEIRELVDEICDWDEYCGRESCNRCGPGIKSWTKKLNTLVKKGRVDPFDFVEPCEPECSKERHAYHKGQWDMATRIRDRLEELEG